MNKENFTPDELNEGKKEFVKEKKEADQEWEEVKDKVSGVDKELEEKLGSGTASPEDLQEMNPGG